MSELRFVSSKRSQVGITFRSDRGKTGAAGWVGELLPELASTRYAR
jgi:hypothetical protein